MNIQNDPAQLRRDIYTQVLDWYSSNGRDLPWRKNATPYQVLVSEIMLQQTQVARVLPIYESFLTTFPTNRSLARASRSQVVRAWGSLGYNSRAVRLHTTANIVEERHGGVIPSDYHELLALPGLGPYTAGAICNFAFGRPVPVVDTNISRVISRILNGVTPMTIKDIVVADQDMIAEAPPGKWSPDWHQGLMDLGALICHPTNPMCGQCPTRMLCKAAPLLESQDDITLARLSLPSHSTQSPYHGSVRYYRGRAIKSLRSMSEGYSMPANRLGKLIIQDYQANLDWPWLHKILVALEKDGLITIRGKGPRSAVILGHEDKSWDK